MSTLNKIHVNKIVYLILFMSILTGQFRYITYIAIILLFHGLGHIIISKTFNWNISSIHILPFGGNIKYDIKLNESIKKEFIVTIAGPIFQIILTLLITKLNFFSLKEIIDIKNISYTILIFNLLPVVPLDGSKIMFLILNKVTSYNKSHIYLIYSSIIITILFIINTINNLTFNFIIILFIISIIKEYNNHNSIINRFLLERHIYREKKGKIKILKGINPKLIWKEKINIFKNNKKIISEEQILNKYFNNE